MAKGRRADGRGVRWKGGRHVTHGYVRLYVPGHPHASKRGYVYEHMVVAATALGRPLPPGSHVHHVDDDGTNNAPANLVICQDAGYHKLLHQRQRALEACGNANARRCYYCKTYERQDAIVVQPRPRAGKVYERAFHQDCAKRYHAARKEKVA